MKRVAIVGAGISGLTVAYWLNKHSPSSAIDVFDSRPQAGGLLKTEIIDDCVVDAGPDSFLTQKKAAWELIDELKLQSEVIGSNDRRRSTSIFYERQLHQLPEGFFLMVPVRPAAFLTTKLLTWSGKLQALYDLTAFPERQDVTVAEFVEKRFGDEILEQIAEPLLTGIYGADIDQLSLKNALPQLWEMQKKGSLILQLRNQKRNNGVQSLFTTFRRGMQTLANALQAAAQNVRWKFGFQVDDVKKTNDRWSIHQESYDAIVFSTARLPRIVSDHGPKIESIVNSVVRNSAIVIALGFRDIHPEGFGWLIPRAERRSILACTYITNKFENRTPPNRFLIRLFIGGKGATGWLDRSDDDIYREAFSEFRRVTNLRSEPIFSRIYRWPDSMPEYRIGHEEKIELLQQYTSQEKSLFITGNLMKGVGIPDCIAHAKQTAEDVLKFIETGKGTR